MPEKSKKIVFKYSRLFCDVERFKDDNKEKMAEKGMGVIYTKDFENTITIPNNKYKNIVIKSYYDKHHNKLDKKVTDILNKYDKCILIDFHSYSDEMIQKLFNNANNPDICIGTDSFYTNEKLKDFTINHFKKYGYTVCENYPYSGTMIPNKYFNKKDNRLSSIMIEINKRVYLNNRDDYQKLKDCIEDYYNKLLSQ